MRVASLTDFLLQRIERNCGKPVNRQLYQAIREAILTHVFPVGLRLPSSRDLANELGIARNTVTYAYDQLMAEGYLETRTGAGTFIADTVPDQIPEVAESASTRSDLADSLGLSQRGAQLIKHAGSYKFQWGAFMPGVPDVNAFPSKIWSRLQNKYWRRAQPDFLTYGHGGGHLGLREAIAEYLRVARSVNCNADQVIVTSGIHQSLDLATKLLADVGDRAWVEDPCYWGTRSVVTALNLKPVPIAVDEEGISPRDSDLRHPPRFIFVTPSHQYPLGQVMSLSRRRMLLEYAAANNIWIMEDDYDSEFRYGSRPLAALQGMDTNDRVLYVGSFSKTMFPGLRVGFVVVPAVLSEAFATGLSDLYRGGQLFLQAVLADFMTEGHFASHIRRMRMLYSERHQLLREAISRNFGDTLAISGDDAGLHMVLLLPAHCDDVAICRQAEAQGIIVRPLSSYYMKSSRAKRGLIFGYACVPNEMVGPCFDRVADIIRRHL